MNNKWGWYEVVYNLAACKLENMDAITKIPAVECFTFMAYQQDKEGVNQVKR